MVGGLRVFLDQTRGDLTIIKVKEKYPVFIYLTNLV